MCLKALEDEARVEAYEHQLRVHLGPFIEHIRTVDHHFFPSGGSCLGGQAWPLRPLFLERRKLDYLSQALYDELAKCQDRLLRASADLDTLCRELRLDSRFLKALDPSGGLANKELLSVFRPDGFYHSDRFLISELNLGPGLEVSLLYTDVLHRILARSPVMTALGWAPEAISRPFETYLNRLGPLGSETTRVVFFSPELEQVHAWEQTLLLQLCRESGLEAILTNQEGDWEGCDLVVRFTVGETYLENPDRLQSSSFRDSMAAFLFGKGLLPWLHENFSPAAGPEGFELELLSTEWPNPEQVSRYRLNKDDYVLKRAWLGKQTAVGCSSHGRAWNSLLALTLEKQTHVLQSYHPLPVVLMPVLVDNRVERIPVRFELSPFIIEGRYAGALVRYAPDREGVILSPSPPDLGFTMVYAS